MEPRTVPELIERTYRRYGDRRAVLGRSGWLTFSEVEHESARAAGAIANAGAAPGDRIVLAVDSGPQARILEYAILGHGFVRVAVSTRLHPREIADIAVDCGATVVFGGEVLRSALEDAGSTAALLDPDARGNPQSVPDVSPADTTMLIYSGGSTGISKGAIVSNAAWIAHTNASLSILPDVDPDDTVLAVAQLPYLGGSIAFDCATAGASTVFLARFSAAKVIDAVVRYGITVLPLASTMLELLAAELDRSGRRLPELRVVPYGGSPIRPDALDRAARLLPSTLVQYYGLAEALAPLVSLSAADHDQAIASGDHTRLRSAGRWLDGIQHRIDNDELLVRGEVVMPGYANRGPAAPLDAQGWFRTGDIVSEDDDGFLYITGRSNDIIMSGGFNVHPSEVEHVVGALEGISGVVVLGMPDARWGDGVTAVVTTDDTDADPRSLLARIQSACRDTIASYKKPVAVHIVDRIPLTAAGKPDRERVRADLVEATKTAKQNDR